METDKVTCYTSAGGNKNPHKFDVLWSNEGDRQAVIFCSQCGESRFVDVALVVKNG